MEIFSLSAHYLAKQLISRGIKHIVLCPGSRNAPLISSLVLLQKNFTLHQEVDERNAAFMAMGLSLATNTCAAVVCTSGSAVLNLLPALSEAFHQGIPILCLTCDRPSEMIGQQDSQTINQVVSLAPFCNHVAVLQNDDIQSQTWYNAREIDRALNAINQVPVHINLPLADPLYNEKDYSKSYYKTHQSTVIEKGSKTLPEALKESLNQEIQNAKRMVVLVGQCSPFQGTSLSKALLPHQDKLTIIAENTSNLNIKGIRNIDPWVNALGDAVKVHPPDLVITIGGHLVSKKLKKLFRHFKSSKFWRIGSEEYYPDTFKHLNIVVNIAPEYFFSSLVLNNEKRCGDWEKIYDNLDLSLKPTQLEHFTDLYVYHHFTKWIRNEGNMAWHFGNSSSIRYAQLFDFHFDSEYYANRGVSGIEGCISTFVGVAKAKKETNHVLIIGDLAFHYNLNGLLHLPSNAKIILVNNAGGNIFRLIDGPGKTHGFESYVESHRNSNHRFIAEHFGIPYLSAVDKREFEEKLNLFFNKKQACIFEIFTKRLDNSTVLKQHLQQFKHGKQEKLDDN